MAACALPISAADALTPAQRQADVAALCRFAQAEYAYADVKATDWPRACDVAAQAAAQAGDERQFIAVLERLVAQWYDAHAHLAVNTASSPRLVPSQTDVLGAWVKGEAVVTAVRGAAAQGASGVRVGDRIVAIDGVPVQQAVAPWGPTALRAPDPAALDWALRVALAGRHDQAVRRLSVQRGGQQMEVSYAQPPTAVADERLSLRITDGIATIRIHNSLGDVDTIAAFDRALAQLGDAQGLVLDLRDTPSGGNSVVARGLLGRFVAGVQPYQMHESVSEGRTTGIRRVWVEYVAERSPRITVPVVVLVGPWTGSMGEGLAIGLAAAAAAPVVGQPMAGLMGALGEVRLPFSLIVVRLPVEKLSTVEGVPREQVVPMPLEVAPFAAAQDPEWAAARALLSPAAPAPAASD